MPCTRSSTICSSGSFATVCFETLTAAEPEAQGQRHRQQREVASVRARPSWLDRARRRRPGGRRRVRGAWGRGTGRPAMARPRQRRGRRRRLTVCADERGAGEWLADEKAGQAGARRQGPAARPQAARAGRWPGSASDTTLARLPGAARPTLVRPGRPGTALPAAGAQVPARRAPTRQLARSTAAREPERRHRRWRVRACCSARWLDLARRARRRPRAARRHARCWPSVELPLTEVLADMEAHRHRRRRRAPQPDCAAELRRPGVTSEPRRTGRSDASSTSARPSSCRWCSSTSSSCPRPSAPRPATPPTPTRCSRCTASTGHPFLEHLLRHRDVARLKTTVDGLLKSVADDGRIHTTFNQTDRRDRPAVVAPTRTCRTSRSAPRRAGASGGRSSSAPGFETLMTADYSQIEMRIMAHLSEDAGLIEAFRSGEDLHPFVASRASSACRWTTSPPSCADGSRRCPTAWPTACRRSAWPQQLRDHRRRGRRADGASTSPGSAGCATTCSGIVDAGPQGRLHRDHPRAAGAICPT